MEVPEDRDLLDLENYVIRKSAAWFSGISEESSDDYIIFCDELRDTLSEQEHEDSEDVLINILKMIFLSTICSDPSFISESIKEEDLPDEDNVENIICYTLSKISKLIYRIFILGKFSMDDMSDIVSELQIDQESIVDYIEDGSLSEEENSMVESIMSLLSATMMLVSFIRSEGSIEAQQMCKLKIMHAILSAKGLKLENTMIFAEAAIHEVVTRYLTMGSSKEVDITFSNLPDPKDLN